MENARFLSMLMLVFSEQAQKRRVVYICLGCAVVRKHYPKIESMLGFLYNPMWFSSI